MKGGDDGDFLGTLFASGLGAYAAKNSTSMGGLLWTLAKYALVLVLILIVVIVVFSLIGAGTERFVPVVPSPEQDRKYKTPAGNVITY
jgi:hypothetical protein